MRRRLVVIMRGRQVVPFAVEDNSVTGFNFFNLWTRRNHVPSQTLLFGYVRDDNAAS